MGARNMNKEYVKDRVSVITPIYNAENMWKRL